MEAMEVYSQNFASKDVSWISSALNEPEKEKTRHTTKAWNVVGRPLKKTVGTGLPSMYSDGIIKRTVVIVKEATKINSNTRVWIGGMELNFESSLRFGRNTHAISEFKAVAEKFSGTFSSDGTHNLIVRLRHNVIRTGLRNISISYSRISLADVAKKLRLDSPNPIADAESIVAKAIRDGAIDATLDHAKGWMVSKETGDIYSTNEPQIAFNSRIAFCLNMHNEAVRALRFPPNSHKEKESAEKRRERQQQEQELAKHIAEEDDDEF